MIYSDIEKAPRKEIEKIQLERLKKAVKYAYENVPFYKKKYDEANVSPDDIKSLEDISKLPFTTKQDLRDNYPYGLMAVDMQDIVRVHASSGTSGKPTVVFYTKADLEMWSECVARIIAAAGGTDKDIVQIAFGYGLFTGALGLHQGWEKIGAAVVPASSGNTERQVMLMKDLKVTALVSTPSYALYISEVMEKMGVKKEDLSLRLGLFGSEASSEAMHKELEKKFGIVSTDNYGLSEIIGPGVSGECVKKCGMHINEDYFYPEIVDTESLEPKKSGFGELVLTALCKEGLPIIRYRTKDITSINYEKCECGRTFARMEKIKGRSDDMLIIRGVNVFPSQIEGVLMGFNEIGGNYEIIVRREGYLDSLEVLVEVNDAQLLINFASLESLQSRIRHSLKTVLQIDAKVKLVEPLSLKRYEGKAKRVTDLRKI